MDDEPLCEGERIAGERQDLNGKREYLVQRKGYDRDSDTWKPEEHLGDCKEALREFRLWQAEEPREGAWSSQGRPRGPASQQCVRPPKAESGEVEHLILQSVTSSEDSQPLYEVERIAGERQGMNGKRAYLVQWKGYDRDSDTWEPEEHLVDCEEALREFRLWQAEKLREGAWSRQGWPRVPAAQQLDGPLKAEYGEPVLMILQSATGSMDCKSLYEVERIAGERQDLNGKREYLVQWKGYDRDLDSWEPEEHLVDCEEALREFRLWQAEKQREGARFSQGSRCGSASLQLVGPLKEESGEAGLLVNNQGTMTTGLLASSQKLRPIGSEAVLKIPMPVNPVTKKLLLDGSGCNCLKIEVDPVAQEHEESAAPIMTVAMPTSLACDTELSGLESSPSIHLLGLQVCGLDYEWKLLKLTLGEGRSSLSKSALATPGRRSRKARLPMMPYTQSRPVVDSRIRAVENLACFRWTKDEGRLTYKDIVVRKQKAYTHIILYSRSSDSNCLNPGIMKEMQHALSVAAMDDSKFVLLGAVGSCFCCGLDLAYLTRSQGMDSSKTNSTLACLKFSDELKSFVNHFIHFRKPIVVAVNGPAIGLGASILALCDIVWSSDKAWFQTPYTIQGQTPDGCCSLTFPKIMGVAAASEMLLGGRKLTAEEACNKGLVSQVFGVNTFTREVMAQVRKLASYHPFVLEECKTLMCCSAKADLEQANIRECETLKRIWASSQEAHSMLKVF